MPHYLCISLLRQAIALIREHLLINEQWKEDIGAPPPLFKERMTFFVTDTSDHPSTLARDQLEFSTGAFPKLVPAKLRFASQMDTVLPEPALRYGHWRDRLANLNEAIKHPETTFIQAV